MFYYIDDKLSDVRRETNERYGKVRGKKERRGKGVKKKI